MFWHCLYGADSSGPLKFLVVHIFTSSSRPNINNRELWGLLLYFVKRSFITKYLQNYTHYKRNASLKVYKFKSFIVSSMLQQSSCRSKANPCEKKKNVLQKLEHVIASYPSLMPNINIIFTLQICKSDNAT